VPAPTRARRRATASERERRALERHDDDFDQVERLTRRVGRAAAVGVPTWIVLLGALPFTGLGVGACLALATGLAIAAVVAAERLRSRGDRPAADRGPARPRRAVSPLAAVGLTLAVVAVLVYVVLVIRAA
jgi:hypothetical protein